MKSGVYKITNKVNGKFYIGSSKDIENRWVCHSRKLNNNDHDNSILQSAWNKYGKENFSFEVVEIVEPIQEKLFEREEYYFKALNPHDNGYNIEIAAKGGDTFTKNPNKETTREIIRMNTQGEKNGMFGKNHTEEAILKQKEQAVGRYTLEWFVERFGQEVGTKKFENRRQMLMNRKINYATVEKPAMSFKGCKHGDDFKEKINNSKAYFKEHWNEFVELVKSKKYSQRQLSEMLNISRVSLRPRMKKALEQ